MRFATVSIAVSLACTSVGCWVHREPEHARKEERKEEKREERREHKLGVRVVDPVAQRAFQ